MSDAGSVRSNASSTLSTGAGFDEKGPYLVMITGFSATRRVLRPGSVIHEWGSKPRFLKEGDWIINGWDKPVQIPRSCQSPYVTPTTSPDNSPALGASGDGQDEIPPKMRLP